MMGLDCEYPNACGCGCQDDGCQDEPTHVGCKCCGREADAENALRDLMAEVDRVK